MSGSFTITSVSVSRNSNVKSRNKKRRRKDPYIGDVTATVQMVSDGFKGSVSMEYEHIDYEMTNAVGQESIFLDHDETVSYQFDMDGTDLSTLTVTGSTQDAMESNFGTIPAQTP